jgi:hypothetical protein
MTVLQLIELLAKQDPNLPVIVNTGVVTCQTIELGYITNIVPYYGMTKMFYRDPNNSKSTKAFLLSSLF